MNSNNLDMQLEDILRDRLLQCRDNMEQAFRVGGDARYFCGEYDVLLEVACKMMYGSRINTSQLCRFEEDIFPHIRYSDNKLARKEWSYKFHRDLTMVRMLRYHQGIRTPE